MWERKKKKEKKKKKCSVCLVIVHSVAWLRSEEAALASGVSSSLLFAQRLNSFLSSFCPHPQTLFAVGMLLSSSSSSSFASFVDVSGRDRALAFVRRQNEAASDAVRCWLLLARRARLVKEARMKVAGVFLDL